MGVQNTALLSGQPLTAAFMVLVQLCGPKANDGGHPIRQKITGITGKEL